jgi:hypothetical protein
MELAAADRGVLRQLTSRLDVPALDELVAATRQAIADASSLIDMHCLPGHGFALSGRATLGLEVAGDGS